MNDDTATLSVKNCAPNDVFMLILVIATTCQPTATPFTPTSHTAYYGHVVDPPTASVLDEVLLLPMLAPRSYTAEDVVEIHCHGGGVCARRVLQALLGAGARLARGGAFCLRAFLNGRLDLSQAESVAQLLGARTVAAADSALAGLQVGGQAGGCDVGIVIVACWGLVKTVHLLCCYPHIWC